MFIDNLVMEITRRCNMRCAHCLRGNPQALDMSDSVIYNTFRDVSEIGCLTLTGGEPSLKPEIIRSIREQLIFQNVNLGFFYVVTNGHSTYRRREFLNELDRLWDLCSEKDMCSLEVSQDNYHEKPNLKYYADEFSYSEYYGEFLHRSYIHLDRRRYEILSVIKDGRAANWGDRVIESPDKIDIEEQELYVSANGNVYNICDASFKRIDKEHFGNVIDVGGLQAIIEENL